MPLMASMRMAQSLKSCLPKAVAWPLCLRSCIGGHIWRRGIVGKNRSTVSATPLATACCFAPIFRPRRDAFFMARDPGGSMIKAILFDMDGVLIDAKDWHYEALNRALGIFGMEIDRDSHVAIFDGLPTRRKLEILSATRSLPKRLHPLIHDLKQAHTRELAYARCRP